MKKRIIISNCIVIIFSLMIMTSFYFVISNHKYIESSRDILCEYSKILKVLLEDNKDNIKEKFKNVNANSNVRITYIDKDGSVIFDTHKNSATMENHLDREEINKAISEGTGYSVRYSEELKKSMIYYTLKLNDGSFIRSSTFLEQTNILEDVKLGYYLLALTLSIIISIILSLKITNTIITPLKELEFITSRIASGELNRRIEINSVDELASLGKSFNHMADRLEDTLEEVLDKQNRLEAILKSMDSGVIAVDKYFRVIMINPYAKKIFNIKGDIIGKKLIKYIGEEVFLNAIKHREECIEITIKNPESRNLRIRTANIINGYDHIGIVAVVQDITDIKKLENMRSQFIANVSHEIKTPLTSIKGFSETLRYVDDEETREKFLKIIEDESERLARLIDDILILYDTEKNKDPISEPFYPNDIIENVKLMVTHEAEKKNIRIIKGLQGDVELIGDKDKFKQMMINLVYNAIKYTEIHGEVSIFTHVNNNKFTIDVTDTGIGISEEDLSRIFERFYRVDKARSRDSGGTGLGLAIVKHIVKSFDGTIDVYSKLGIGTTFTITIQIKK